MLTEALKAEIKEMYDGYLQGHKPVLDAEELNWFFSCDPWFDLRERTPELKWVEARAFLREAYRN